MVPHQSALSSLSSPSSLVPYASALRDVWDWVVETRRNNLEFRDAVSRHERDHSLFVSGEAKTPGPPKGSRSRRRFDHQGPENRADLALRPPTTAVPRLPKNIGNVPVWDVVKIRTAGTTSTSVITETNFSVGLSAHPQASSWAALFDQFCIPQFTVSFYSQEAPGGAQSPIELHTAIDFDNITSLGTISAIDDFGSARVVNLQGNRAFTRSVRPCFKSTASGINSASINRGWVDCATPTVQHFGIRSIIGPSNSAVVGFYTETCVWYAFRNTI
jgi:hypothetical protein